MYVNPKTFGADHLAGAGGYLTTSEADYIAANLGHNEDTTWRNDAAPSLAFAHGGALVQIYIDAINPELRECRSCRFFVMTQDHEHDVEVFDIPGTNSLADAVATFKAEIAQVFARRCPF